MSVALPILCAIVFPVAMLAAVRARNRARLAPLAELLDGQSGDLHGFLRLSLQGHRGGREAAIELTPGSRHSPPRLILRVGCAVPGSFRIGREDLHARIAKKLHLEGDVEVGDAELDAKYVFRTDDPESLKRWLRKAEVRESLMAVMDRRGGEAIALRNGALAAIQQRPKSADLERGSIGETFEALERLGQAFD